MTNNDGKIDGPNELSQSLVQSLSSQNAETKRHSAALEKLNENILLQNSLLFEQLEVLKKIHWNASQSRVSAEIVSRMTANDFLDSADQFLAERMLGLLETINLISDRKLNVARFGDGEIRLMFSPGYNISFQDNSFLLRNSLHGVLEYASLEPEKLLVAFPPIMREPIWATLYAEHWKDLRQVLASIPVMGNSFISRPRLFQAFGKKAVEAWSAVWAGKKVTVVTGKGSRFSLSRELFESTISVDICYSEPKNAFEDIPRLMNDLAHDQNDLILISLGPAGSVLAAELAKTDKWALDIGHISSSYAQVFEGAGAPEMIPFQES